MNILKALDIVQEEVLKTTKEIIAKDQEIVRLKLERNFWKEKSREAHQSYHNSELPVELIMQNLEKEIGNE